MLELLVTSSFLIIIILVMRFFLKKKISANIQYAVWLLVVIRLIFPINLIHSNFSILNVIDNKGEITLPKNYENVVSYKEKLISEAPKVCSENQELPSESNIKYINNTLYRNDILHKIWFIGFFILSIALISTNAIYYIKLKKERISLEKKKGNVPVYLMKNISSPCLFGIFRPKIYVTFESLEEKRLNYILTHEFQHYKHLDHIWALVREICIAVYWFHPLVWVAAVVSKLDCEMACDESTIKSLGEHERINYGITLVDMSYSENKSHSFEGMAVMMAKKQSWLKKRILTISKKPQNLVKNLVLYFMILTITVFSIFTAGKNLIENDYIYGNSFRRYYSEGLSLTFKKDKFQYKAGYIDNKGNEVIQCTYEDGMAFSEGLASVKKQNKYGYIDKNGKEVIPFIYDKACNFNEGLAPVMQDDKYGYINLEGKCVIPFSYDYGWEVTEGLAAVEKDGKWGYIDKNGNEVIPFIYDLAYYYNDGLAPVEKDNKYGYINKEGKEIIPFIYEAAREFSDGLAEVKYNGKYGCIDKNGDVVIPFIYDNARQFSEGLIPVEKNYKWGYIDRNGNVVIPFIYDDAEHFSEGMAVVCNDGEMQYIKNPKRIHV